MKHLFKCKHTLDEVLVENSTYRATDYLRKRLVAEGLKQHKCEGCHRSRWRGKPIPLELHHINGNRRDNRLPNLKLLCPNCHAQTPNYAGKKNKIHKKCRCGATIHRRSARCKCCSAVARERKHVQEGYRRKSKIEWPPLSLLLSCIQDSCVEAVARQLDVTGNAVRHHVTTEKRYGTGLVFCSE